MRLHGLLLFSALALVVSGCMTKRLTIEGADVATVSQEPSGCERLGDVAGRAGGGVQGEVTSIRDLDRGARNELRNNAGLLGADTVQILRREGVTPQNFSGHGTPTEVRFTGVAWRCGRV